MRFHLRHAVPQADFPCVLSQLPVPEHAIETICATGIRSGQRQRSFFSAASTRVEVIGGHGAVPIRGRPGQCLASGLAAMGQKGLMIRVHEAAEAEAGPQRLMVGPDDICGARPLGLARRARSGHNRRHE